MLDVIIKPFSPHQLSMRFVIIPFIFLAIILLVDVYAWQAIKTSFGKKQWVRRLYWGTTAALMVGMLAILLFRIFEINVPSHLGYWVVTVAFLSFLPKLVIAFILLLEDIARIISRFFRYITRGSKPQEKNVSTSGSHRISRKKFISQSALALSAIPFAHLLHGVTVGRYNFQVNRFKIPIKNLPESFEGLTITQISDLHTGTFSDKEGFMEGIELIKKQGSDLIFFTGDLINYHIDEVQGFESAYSSLTAPLGVFSVLGNHDYGDYNVNNLFPSAEARRLHNERVAKTHGQFGWNLLKNQNHIIQRGEDSLAVIGVENWGKSWTQYGDLDKAVEGTENANVKLLLSHDPSHWDAQVRVDQPDIDMTFSGHTHGMQYGVEIPSLGIKWSPVKWIYKQWAGLYQEGNQYLHVSRGFGHIGFMGRAGIMPEITVFELVKG